MTDQVYELVETDLERVLKSREALSGAQVQAMVRQTLLALQHLHSSGLVHCDLRPATLLLTADRAVKLTGFGLSRPFPSPPSPASPDASLPLPLGPRPPTLERNAHHVRYYCAPELALTGQVTPAADVWLLGCIFGELLERESGSGRLRCLAATGVGQQEEEAYPPGGKNAGPQP